MSRRTRGFALIESVITVLLVAVIGGIAAMSVVRGGEALSLVQGQLEAARECQRVLDLIEREVELLRSNCATDLAAQQDRLVSMRADGSPLVVERQRESLLVNGAVLCDQVAAFRVRCLRGDGGDAHTTGETRAIDVTLELRTNRDAFRAHRLIVPRALRQLARVRPS